VRSYQIGGLVRYPDQTPPTRKLCHGSLKSASGEAKAKMSHTTRIRNVLLAKMPALTKGFWKAV